MTGVLQVYLQVAQYTYINIPLMGTARHKHVHEETNDAQNSCETGAWQRHHYHYDVVSFLDVTITSADLYQKLLTSIAVLADISVRSPWKWNIDIIRKTIIWAKVSQNSI